MTTVTFDGLELFTAKKQTRIEFKLQGVVEHCQQVTLQNVQMSEGKQLFKIICQQQFTYFHYMSQALLIFTKYFIPAVQTPSERLSSSVPIYRTHSTVVLAQQCFTAVLYHWWTWRYEGKHSTKKEKTKQGGFAMPASLHNTVWR